MLSLANGILVAITVCVASMGPTPKNPQGQDAVAPDCTESCAATATVVNIPAGTCGANMPTYTVDWGQSTSGVCEGCTVVHHCNNHAVLTIIPAAGTFLNGGGFACDGAGGNVTGAITTCGQASTSQIHVHTGNPCTDANSACTVYVTIGCKNC